MNNRVSCLLNVHNQEKYIDMVCEGIVNSISDNVKQIVVVLDGCIDNSESIIKNKFKNLKIKIDYVFTDNVFETRANNAGFKRVENDYVIIIQDDMVIKEKEFDKRMLKPFLEFKDVFAVSAQTAHNNFIFENELVFPMGADRRTGYSRNQFGVREVAIRGPLMYDFSDVVKLNYFDEELAPDNFDDHDLSYKAFTEFGKVSGLYWIDFDSEREWAVSTRVNQNIHYNSFLKNMQIMISRHGHLMSCSAIPNEDRDLQ